ncbi:MAG: hypothetical protein JWQ42_2413 [Edaphobacter sp.]|nr:hypothetical protein [Edaphobacter sp.]
MGMAERISELVDPKNDPVGLQLEEENLPQRIRRTRKNKPAKGLGNRDLEAKRS